MSASLLISNISVVDRAEIPLKRSGPRTGLNLLIGCLVGLVGGVALAFLFEYLDTSIRDPREIEALLRVPTLGLVPTRSALPAHLDGRPLGPGAYGAFALVAHQATSSILAEAFRNLRTSVVYATPGRPPKTMLVTSLQQQDGKTSVSTNCAITLAQLGTGDVLLVDADLRHPDLHRILDVPQTPGLSDLLVGGVGVAEVIRPTRIPGLFVIPAGPVPTNPAELLFSPRFTQALAAVGERFAHIVIDSPPMLEVSDTLVLAPRVEGVILVLRQGHTGRDAAQRAVQMLGSVRAHLLGVVLNHADVRSAAAGYQYLPPRTHALRVVDVGGLDDAGAVRASAEVGSGPGRRHPLRRPLVTTRRASVVLVDLLLTVAGNYFAFWLRFDGAIPAPFWNLWRETIPLLVLLRGLSFFLFHLHDSVWRYVGLRDLRAIVACVTASGALFCLLIRGGLGLRAYPRSVFLMDVVLVVLLMVAARVGWRLWREYRANARTKRVLVFGAGEAGARIVGEMLKGGEHGYHPVGFVDDDPAKVGQRIHGIPVLGTRADLPRIIGETNPSEVLVAIARAAPGMFRGVVKELESHKLLIRAMPHLRDILDGRARLHDVRDLAVADLLGRVPVGLAMDPVRHLVEGKRVLVTGAGGIDRIRAQSADRGAGAEEPRAVRALRERALGGASDRWPG